MALVLGIPHAEILDDSGIADAALLFEFTQRGDARILAGFDAALHQLQASLRMLERQDLSHRGIAKQHRAGFVGSSHCSLSLILVHLSNFSANDMPACAGLVDGRSSYLRPANSAGRLGNTKRRYISAALRPLKKTRRMCGWERKKAAKSFARAEAWTMELSRLPGHSAAADRKSVV